MSGAAGLGIHRGVGAGALAWPRPLTPQRPRAVTSTYRKRETPTIRIVGVSRISYSIGLQNDYVVRVVCALVTCNVVNPPRKCKRILLREDEFSGTCGPSGRRKRRSGCIPRRRKRGRGNGLARASRGEGAGDGSAVAVSRRLLHRLRGRSLLLRIGCQALLDQHSYFLPASTGAFVTFPFLSPAIRSCFPLLLSGRQGLVGKDPPFRRTTDPVYQLANPHTQQPHKHQLRSWSRPPAKRSPNRAFPRKAD